MTNYSLRARMMILILAPTVLIGLLLSIFFVVHRYNDLQRQLEDAGASIIEPLAVSSEYGMNLQNRESIGQLISVLHRRHSDIVRAISVYDDHNRLFVTSNFHLDPSQMQLPAGAPFPRRLSVDRHGDIMILRTPIISESYSPDESAIADAKNTKNMLGYVALELDLKSVRLQQYKEIFISSVMMLFCIGIALIFGWRLMRDVTGPIRNMVNTVDRIRRGQLDSRVEGFMLGELDMLKNGINSMAMSLAAYHEEMQHNIDQATSDLRETLEQMEIQNVELDLAKKRAQEAARIKSEFLANMSHELRTPLNGVIGFTRLTLKTELNPTQRDHLNTIERSANNLLAIINDVLDFSKLEAGKLILESIPFPLRNTLDEVVTLLAHSSHDKGLELTLNIKNDVPDNVIGDPLRLQQVITNLVGNAIKFTESGNIDILVEKRALSNTKLGYNAIAAGFQGQRHWTDQYPNGDTAEALLNSSFDWNGVREPFVVATENDSLNGVAMLFGHQLTGTAQIFADVRTYWSPEAVERVTGQALSGLAEHGIIHLINSGSAALDGACKQRDSEGKPTMKPHWEISQQEADACLAATEWCPAIHEYFRGGGYSSRFLTEGGVPFTMTRVNIIKGLGPVLQIAEGWSVELPKAMHDQLDARTNSTWPTTWFAPRLTGKGPFTDVYSVMANWGANHGVLTIGHVGADFITLAAMLRIPVCMHNVEEAKIYRPSAWAAHGMDIEGQDYRACQNYGPLYKR
ncbi:TPA_asm: HAMP domain-containing protein [Salmonella enterica]|nr:HAMP domain-containing protein [Salmonella enterica subsp. enterica serovar Enteritidis]